MPETALYRGCLPSPQPKHRCPILWLQGERREAACISSVVLLDSLGHGLVKGGQACVQRHRILGRIRSLLHGFVFPYCPTPWPSTNPTLAMTWHHAQTDLPWNITWLLSRDGQKSETKPTAQPLVCRCNLPKETTPLSFPDLTGPKKG